MKIAHGKVFYDFEKKEFLCQNLMIPCALKNGFSFLPSFLLSFLGLNIAIDAGMIGTANAAQKITYTIENAAGPGISLNYACNYTDPTPSTGLGRGENLPNGESVAIEAISGRPINCAVTGTSSAEHCRSVMGTSCGFNRGVGTHCKITSSVARCDLTECDCFLHPTTVGPTAQ